MFPSAMIIRTKRSLFDTVQSMQRCYGWSYIDSLVETMRRETALDHFLVGHHVFDIDFNRKWFDKDLKLTLEDIINAYL